MDSAIKDRFSIYSSVLVADIFLLRTSQPDMAGKMVLMYRSRRICNVGMRALPVVSVSGVE